ncbi:hypothetical protein BIW11_10077 [Tropilaelaps mercedesae]|uniref:Uncharacterized protein n=1 Tax=Tropilaelaps mercedesae TaxID=418985 RepID=A0A1V9XHL0_9ACAR|nr:hypothetical protein BIW11_10077 [Tropilaelaps mercedesae]
MVVRYDTSASPSTRARLKLRALLKKLNAPHSNFMPPFAFYLKEQYDESAQISTTRHPHTVPGTMVNDEDRAVMLKSETADTPSESSTGVSTQSKKSAHAKTHLVSWQRIMKEAGIKWSSLPESEKIAFHKKAEEMKNINRKAMIAWWETLSADERNLIAYSYARVKAVTTFEAPSRAPKGVCELCLRPIKTSQRPKSKTLLARKFPEGLPWSYIWKLEMKKETDEKRLSKKCNGEAERGMNVNT